MSNSNNHPVTKNSQNLNDFDSIEVNESKFWRKVKQDPVVPIGLLELFFYLLKFSIYFERYDRIWFDRTWSDYWF
jgi:hypothetical protein